MGGFVSVLDALPPWIGSAPAWATFILVGGWILQQWVKNRPILNQQQINERLSIKAGYIDRITKLEDTVAANQIRCENEKRELQAHIEILQDKIRNEAEQRTQSEISLVSTLIQIVDAPQLKEILKALENKQVRLLQVHALSGPLAEGADE